MDNAGTFVISLVTSVTMLLPALGAFIVLLRKNDKVVEKLEAQDVIATETKADLAVIKLDVNSNYTALSNALEASEARNDEREEKIAERDVRIAELLEANRVSQDTKLTEALDKISQLEQRLANQSNGGPSSTQQTGGRQS